MKNTLPQIILPQLSNSKHHQTTENDIIQLKTQPEWSWYPSKFVLSQKIEERQIFWKTSPSIQMHNSKTKNLKGFQVTCNMPKHFNYNDQNKWNWHKSWILPQINIQIASTDNNQNKFIHLPENIYVSVYAVKADNSDNQNFLLVNVGIQGISKIKAQVGCNIFSNLKFDSTSFKHKGALFNLLVIVAAHTDDEIDKIGLKSSKVRIPHVLWSFISPPIFVDSRKPSKTQICASSLQSLNANSSSIYLQFNPKLLDIQMVKRRSHKCEPITMDFQGFINYFKAPNLRNKIKNPFFLCCRFPQCFTLYYNRFRISNSEEIIQICLEEFKNELKKIQTRTSYQKLRIIPDKINLNAFITIHVNAKSIADKRLFGQILNKFGSIDNSLINFIYEQSLIVGMQEQNSKENGRRFLKMKDIISLREQYECYFNRQQYKRNGIYLFGGKDEEQDEQYEEQGQKKEQIVREARYEQIEKRKEMEQQNVVSYYYGGYNIYNPQNRYYNYQIHNYMPRGIYTLQNQFNYFNYYQYISQ